MIETRRRWNGHSLAAVVYAGETVRGTVTALWSDETAVAVTWRYADAGGRVLGDHAGDYLDAEQLLLRATVCELRRP